MHPSVLLALGNVGKIHPENEITSAGGGYDDKLEQIKGSEMLPFGMTA